MAMDIWERFDAQDKAIAALKVQVNRVKPELPDTQLTNGLNELRVKLGELSSKVMKDEQPSTRLRLLIQREVFEAIQANGETRLHKPRKVSVLKDDYRDKLIALIVRTVEKKWHTGIINKSRKQSVATARHVAAYLLREMTSLSFPEIGLVLGRDHTSIMHARNTVRQRVAENPEFARTITSLREQIEKNKPKD